MIERKTALEQPEMNRSGVLGVKIAKLIVDGDQEMVCEWHRTGIPADADPVSYMQAVSDHLVSMGYPPVSEPDINCVIAAHSAMKNWLGL